MTEEKKVQATPFGALNEDDLRRIIQEVLTTELRHIVRDELRAVLSRMSPVLQESTSPIGRAPAFATPGGFSVRPAGWWGAVKGAAKRVGRTAVGVTTAPFTGAYGAVTGDWDGAKWSGRQTVDGVAGSGTWNQIGSTAQRTTAARTENAYNQWGVFVGWNVYCGRCGGYLGITQSPVGSASCQCSAINVW
ncbi:MAG: hypothetical protein DRP45_11950 [Candidatus Zixiibacteriota bacterium]|nr:MAG: hypothetical protein DRP45_11950 [candidate division Zixibacteria bacterium]